MRQMFVIDEKDKLNPCLKDLFMFCFFLIVFVSRCAHLTEATTSPESGIILTCQTAVSQCVCKATFPTGLWSFTFFAGPL